MRKWLIAGCLLILFSASHGLATAENISVILDPGVAPRVEFGASRVVQALTAVGMEAVLVRSSDRTQSRRIIVGSMKHAGIQKLVETGQLKLASDKIGQEGFVLASLADGATAVAGSDDSGTLYGCLELAHRIRQAGKIPAGLRFVDAPEFVLRGPCIGMQKPTLLPGRRIYEYPYTPDLFPFFYDKAFWQEYLDFLVEQRMNTLYLWNGHPFASLVKLKDYPYAVEVPEEIFQKNVEMYRYIVQEADKRGIWLVQMFYSIILSKPFAEHNKLETQLSAPTPLASDYMRKSISEFVKQYPNVGLLVCLGEALRGLENQVQWTVETILPGVLNGMKEASLVKEPPVIIRAHATDPNVVLPEALKIYHNLFT